MQDVKPGTRRPAGRTRLIATARELFTRHGASNVGINDVIASAGVARMTLYNNFSSKEVLIATVYEDMIEATLAELATLAEAPGTESERILAIFDHFDRGRAEAAYRGCPFIHASLQEHDPSGAVHGLVREYKRALRTHVMELLDASRRDRAILADQVVLLLDGAVTEAYLGGVDEPVRAGKSAVARLLGVSN